MKLPEDRKQRIQVLVLIGIGCVVVLILLAQFAIVPIIDSRRKLAETREEYRARLEKAQRELKASAQIQAEFDEVTRQLQAIASDYLLRPILGSYLVGVTEAMEPRAKETGFVLDDIQERGVQALRLQAKETAGQRPYNAYSAQISGQGSYAEIMAFLNAIETRNPYVCVTELRISGQPDNPSQHRVSLRIEWPIEVENALRSPDAAVKEAP
jgi:Tfp pilus assembly protein PilO